MPPMPLWITRLIMILCLIGTAITPLIPKLIPNPEIQAYVVALFVVVAAINHQVAANSNPDGTPAKTAYQPKPDA